ncbi:MAG: hypothetical protein UV76_C0002G0099 [Candidatus Nomurabacteria bacterium GW2011_GWA2_43_15]|uniref:Uncharacterized protein n=2 Tax=Candidatus Nomuraibacteriota TaxID=1752729 RepID=A0A0G1DTH8_9BACT|nr:MAG: hypothetical protein UV76_C0002G0099 [Candidatus Nomurabacteria bacterium GW2011_GWA2_43_15]KKT19858.1 MAG: hypothetical protein UW02_C0004G0035 [Candidatus Nomurabacteria bacterium GW2011_GWB1_43_7]
MLIFLSCLVLFYYRRPLVYFHFHQKFSNFFAWESYPETNIAKGNILIANGKFFKSLTLISINGTNSTETLIDNLTGEYDSFQAAVIAENKVFYVKQENSNIQLMSYDLNSKDSKVVDTFIATNLFTNPYSNPVDNYKLFQVFYDKVKNEIILYHQGEIRFYGISNQTLARNIKLWDLVKSGESRNPDNFKLNPNSQELLVGDRDHGIDPIFVNIIEGSLVALFPDLYFVKDKYSLGSSCKYEESAYINTGNNTLPIKCDLSNNYKCSIVCPKAETFSNLNKKGYGNLLRDNKLAMLTDDEFVIKNEILYWTYGCSGGGFVGDPLIVLLEPGGCIEYRLVSLQKINSSATTNLYAKGITDKSKNWYIGDIISSANKKYIAYADSALEGFRDTYILSLSGKEKPKLLIKNAYPLYFEVGEQ